MQGLSKFGTRNLVYFWTTGAAYVGTIRWRWTLAFREMHSVKLLLLSGFGPRESAFRSHAGRELRDPCR